jgi:hypothetical protein
LRWRSSAPYWLDVAVFEQLLAAGATDLSAGDWVAARLAGVCHAADEVERTAKGRAHHASQGELEVPGPDHGDRPLVAHRINGHGGTMKPAARVSLVGIKNQIGRRGG